MTGTSNETDRRRGVMRALAADVPQVVKPALGKRGFSEGQMVAQWADIVGADLARRVMPEKLIFPPGERRDGTLRLRVAPGFALEAQHREPQVLERLNGFFGYRALARLTLVQGPLPKETPAAPRRRRDLAPGERAALAQRVAGIADSELRDALTRLGEAVIGSGGNKIR